MSCTKSTQCRPRGLSANLIRKLSRFLIRFSFQLIKPCSPAIYDANNLIIFIHLNIDPDTICRIFNSRYAEMIKARSPSKPWRSWQYRSGSLWHYLVELGGVLTKYLMKRAFLQSSPKVFATSGKTSPICSKIYINRCIFLHHN